MNNQVLLSISTVIMDQDTPDAQPYVIQVGGHMYKKGDAFYILYEEDAPDHNGVVKVRIKLKQGTVEIRREGKDTYYNLEFTPQKLCHAQYITPYGSIPLQVKAREVSYRISADEFEAVTESGLGLKSVLQSEVESTFESDMRDRVVRENLCNASVVLSYELMTDNRWIGDYYVKIDTLQNHNS